MHLRIENSKGWALKLASGLIISCAMTACAQSERPVPVKRIVLEYTGVSATIALKPTIEPSLGRQTNIVKVLPPSDSLPEGTGPFSGFWYELQDSKGVVKYRRIIGNPIRPPGSTGDAPAQRIFSVLIPTPGEGDQLVFFSSPMFPGGEALPAGEIGRIDLTSKK